MTDSAHLTWVWIFSKNYFTLFKQFQICFTWKWLLTHVDVVIKHQILSPSCLWLCTESLCQVLVLADVHLLVILIFQNPKKLGNPTHALNLSQTFCSDGASYKGIKLRSWHVRELGDMNHIGQIISYIIVLTYLSAPSGDVLSLGKSAQYRYISVCSWSIVYSIC